MGRAGFEPATLGLKARRSGCWKPLSRADFGTPVAVQTVPRPWRDPPGAPETPLSACSSLRLSPRLAQQSSTPLSINGPMFFLRPASAGSSAQIASISGCSCLPIAVPFTA
jgi:hypothetical protein